MTIIEDDDDDDDDNSSRMGIIVYLNLSCFILLSIQSACCGSVVWLFSLADR